MRKMNARAVVSLVLICAMILSVMTGCGAKKEDSPYADPANWAYCETDVTGKDADVFFINPTVYLGDEEHLFWSEYDEGTKNAFVGAINMEKGIYDADARFFAPFYHQAALSAYYLPAEESDSIFQAAYEEVKDAFLYYLDHYNEGRPIILAGFSQGGDMAIRLLKDVFAEESINKLLVACYAIGWHITEEEIAQYPHMRFATGEKDTGVLIAFNSESEEINGSIVLPEGVLTLAINPLNWKTDGTPADKALNMGACFTDYSGEIVNEIPQLTGAYIDSVRGALKVTDVTPADYPGVLFPDGVYHLYDYQFFYRNLQQNVQTRLDSYLNG